jgi:hypothetical protein
MKPKIFTSVLLFISAYSPLIIILAIKDIDFDHLVLKHPLTIYIMLSFAVISIVLLFSTFRFMKRGNQPVTIIKVQNRSADLINYTIPYIVSFFSFDLAKPDDVLSLAFFMLLLLFLTIKSKSVFLNPILLLCSYNLYDIEYEFDSKIYKQIILSKDDPSHGTRFYIRKLTRFLYLTTEKINTNDIQKSIQKS